MGGFTYKVTVIIPIYNAENTLARTMDSLFRQTIDQKQMEIILINDGSKDGSPALCDWYASEHENVKVIHQENTGVSAARNAGIRAARGKYLLFLDCDDTLSSETIKNVTAFFDVHYDEIDLVTYPITYHEENGNIYGHWRYTKYLKKTGVYDLAKGQNAYISQTTMNICVKNRIGTQIFFNEKLKIGEDQLYITTVMAERGTIGFVESASYNYFKSSTNATSKGLSPYYCFDDMILKGKELIKLKQIRPHMVNYIENLFLYNLNWRISTDALYPYHYSEEKMKVAKRELGCIINELKTQNIMAFPTMDEVYKYFLLSLRTKNKPFICCEKNAFLAIDNDGEFRRFKNVLVVITRSEIKREKLYLLAHAKCLTTGFLRETPKIYAVVNETKRIELDTYRSSHSHYHTKMLTSDFPAFHFELELANVNSIYFEISINGNRYPCTFYFMETQQLKDSPQYYITDGKYKVCADNRCLNISEGSFGPACPKAGRKISCCRAFMGSPKHRIWLYCDRNGVFDNGYYQFKHDSKKKDGIIRYYIYDGDRNAIREKFSQYERKHLIKFGSPMHKVLFSKAEYVLTSFVDDVFYRPFDRKTFAFYRGVSKAKIIYLQHGILHAKALHYSKERLEIDKIVVSGEYEKNVFIKECGFNEEDLILCGMPRLDLVKRNTTKTKKILYAPSWRDYLVRPMINRMWQPVPENALVESVYFKGMIKLLNDPQLKKTLEDEGYSIELKLHPIFDMYENIFKKYLPNIKIVHGEVKLEEYAAFITDFSSFLYDFAYLNRPIFYFVPDISEFKAGLNGYRELYVPFEQGLGYFSSDVNDVVLELSRSIHNNLAVDNVYLERMNSVFSNYEHHHSDDLYEYLLNGEKKWTIS